MKYIDVVCNSFYSSRNGMLYRFFSSNQMVNISDWAKNTWGQILAISLFGEIAENVAVDLANKEQIGPCTIAIVRFNNKTFLLIADKIGVTKVNLSALSPFSLERIAGILKNRIYPAYIQANSKAWGRQQFLYSELAAMEKEDSGLYLAGV